MSNTVGVCFWIHAGESVTQWVMFLKFCQLMPDIASVRLSSAIGSQGWQSRLQYKYRIFFIEDGNKYHKKWRAPLCLFFVLQFLLFPF